MSPNHPHLPLAALLLFGLSGVAIGQEAAYESPDAANLIEDAESAAIPEITADATIVDWEQNVLREGTNGWTCMPTPPTLEGPAPMCLDGEWLGWAKAWMGKEPTNTSKVGLAYMLAGDGGASNTDPYAEGPTEGDDWVVAGPHLMVIVPDNADLEGFTTDPKNGGPWVMWKDTPYAHIMVPVAHKKKGHHRTGETCEEGGCPRKQEHEGCK